MSSQPEEPITVMNSKPLESGPAPQGNKDPQKAATTRELAGAKTITQQPQPPINQQTEVPATMVAREPWEPEPTTLGDIDPNKPEEQKPVTQEDAVTPEAAPTLTQGQDQQLSNDATENTTPELGQDIRADPRILDIMEAE